MEITTIQSLMTLSQQEKKKKSYPIGFLEIKRKEDNDVSRMMGSQMFSLKIFIQLYLLEKTETI